MNSNQQKTCHYQSTLRVSKIPVDILFKSKPWKLRENEIEVVSTATTLTYSQSYTDFTPYNWIINLCCANIPKHNHSTIRGTKHKSLIPQHKVIAPENETK